MSEEQMLGIDVNDGERMVSAARKVVAAVIVLSLVLAVVMWNRDSPRNLEAFEDGKAAAAAGADATANPYVWPNAVGRREWLKGWTEQKLESK